MQFDFRQSRLHILLDDPFIPLLAHRLGSRNNFVSTNMTGRGMCPVILFVDIPFCIRRLNFDPPI